MTYYFVKTILSAIIIVVVTELAKVSSWFAALVTSLPLISILALSWIYIDTKNIEDISQLSVSIFYLVLPSLVFFLLLPYLLRLGVSFWTSMGLSCLVTALVYIVYAFLLKSLVFNYKLFSILHTNCE